MSWNYPYFFLVESILLTAFDSGDSNLAAIGQFYSDPKLQISKDKDYRYMPNVISSAIVDAPASEFLSDALIKRNKLHLLDTKTVEDMRSIFASDVDGKSRNNKRLLPRRNWCSIREYDPGKLKNSNRAKKKGRKS